MKTTSNRKRNRKGPPAWMNDARVEAAAPTVNLPPLEVIIADIDIITSTEDAAEYTPPASVYLFTGRDLGWDKFISQEVVPHSEADIIREIDALSRLVV